MHIDPKMDTSPITSLDYIARFVNPVCISLGFFEQFCIKLIFILNSMQESQNTYKV